MYSSSELETFGGEPELLYIACSRQSVSQLQLYLGWIMTQLSPARLGVLSVTLASLRKGMHVGMSSVTIALAIAIIMYGQGCIDPVE